MKIYGDRLSGNCYKLTLVTSILGIDFTWIDINTKTGDTKTESFLKLNPNGKIPVLVLDDGRILSESNAILNHLSFGSFLWPTDSFEIAKVLQWQFFEQYSHEPYIAVARYIQFYLGIPEDRKEEYKSKQKGGHKALAVMENQLSMTPFLCGKTFTVADISLFAYTHVADEGGFDLTNYPNIKNWITRIKLIKNFVNMRS